MAIQRLLLPESERLNAYGLPQHGGPAPRYIAPVIKAPGSGARLQVGSGPIAPGRERPGRLAGFVRPLGQTGIQTARVALDRIRIAGLSDDAKGESETPQTANSPTATEPESSETEIASLVPPEQITPDVERDKQPEATTAAPDDTDDQPVAEDLGAPTSLAPEQMDDVPLKRPAVPEEPTVDESITDTASVEPDNKPDETSAETTSENALALKDNAETDLAPSVAASPEIRPQDDAPPASDQDQVEIPDAPSDFAALVSPAPSKRPKVFERQISRQVATPTTVAAVTIPRTVRSAAKEVGLELDQTALIGVIDARSGRQALVRMPTGDYRKVGRGDVLDGWRVSSIGVRPCD